MCFEKTLEEATELQSYRATGKIYLPVICLWLLAIIISPQVTMGQINPNNIKQSYSFIENNGQWDSDVLFLAKSNSLRVWITKKSMVFEQFEIANPNDNDRNSKQNKEIKAYAIALEFQNSKNAVVEKSGEGKTKFNYFIGNDKSKHKTGVMQYEDVMLKGIYDGIDMRYYFDGGEVRYDYIVQPYADPTQIELEIKGSQENKLENGELVMKTILKPVVKQGLYAYQKKSDDSKQTVNSSFVLTGNKLKLNIGEYDKSKVLVIDPLTLVNTLELVSNDTYDTFYDLSTTANGDIYFCGQVPSSSFTHATGSYNGSTEAVVGKINSDLWSYDWITFFGGSEEDWPKAVEVDASNLYLTGTTKSDESSFPTDNAHPDFKTAYNTALSSDAFFSVFDLTNGSLKYSCFLNAVTNMGSYPDIKVSSQGNVYLTGTIARPLDTLFIQTCPNTTQTCVPIPSTEMGYIMKFTPISSTPLEYSLAFSTTIEGNGPTNITALDIDEDNYIYITGTTSSTASCIGITSGAYNTVKVPDTRMIYAAKLQYTNCLNIVYNTYISDVGLGQGDGAFTSRCLLVQNDTMYVGGAVESDVLPLKNEFDGVFNNQVTEAFISVIAPNGQGEADLLYSSYFGGSGPSSINSLDYDEDCNSLIFTGGTGSALHDYQGADIEEEFFGTTYSMVGVVNIGLVLKNTLIDLAYLEGHNAKAVKFNSSDNKIRVGGQKSNVSQDMAFYLLDKRPCTIAQGCECSMLDQPENWITLGNDSEPLTPEDTVCIIDLSLDIPSPYDDCFSHFKLVVNNQIGGEIINSEIKSLNWFESIVMPYTLRFGEETVITLTLYRHENDKSPCTINKVYKCPCDCPEETEDWFTMTIGPMPDSCETDCYVQHNLNIPEHIDCFKYYYYSNPQQGIEAGEEPFSLDDVEDQISQFNGCIGYGETSGAIVTLLRYPGDTEPCILEYSVHCDSNIVIPDWIPPPCDTTCAIPYDLDTLSYTSTICPNCEILVWYRTRVNCEGEQELEVFKITYLLRGCDKCNEDVIFREAVYRIIKRNKMVFEPVSVGCDTTWRVGMGSCWAWTSELYFTIAIEVIRDPVTGIIISIDIRLIPHERWIHKKCDDTDCCSILIEVCRDLNNDVTITPIAGPDEWQECDPHMIFDIWGRGYLCAPKCDWLIGWYPYLIEPKDDNSKNHLNHSINQHNNYVSSIQEGNVLKITEATIIIYDLIGRQVLSRQITINNNETESVLQIKDLNNGVYRYVIMIDGKVIKSDKILITK